MAKLTLAGQQVTSNDMLIKGIIDSITAVNHFYQTLPFKGIHGNALAYNRELSGVDPTNQSFIPRGEGEDTDENNKRFSRHSTELTTILGDDQVNGLIQAVGSDFNDAIAIQVASKAKGLGRKVMNFLMDGVKSAPDNIGEMTYTATADNVKVTDYVDVLIDRVHDEGGMVDYIMMSSSGARKFTQALRAGRYDDVMTVDMNDGGKMYVQSYRGVPIFRNDSDSYVTASESAGKVLQELSTDDAITRVKWHIGLANFSFFDSGEDIERHRKTEPEPCYGS